MNSFVGLHVYSIGALLLDDRRVCGTEGGWCLGKNGLYAFVREICVVVGGLNVHVIGYA